MNFKDLSTKKKIADSDKARKLCLPAKKRVSDSNIERVEDFIRSGGSGSLRSSIFNRTDEVVTDEIVDEFYDNFADLTKGKIDVDGGDLDNDGKKQVCWYTIELPDKVPVGSIEALLAKVDYDKNERRFTAYYRPKNGKWGQGKKTGRKAPKK